MKKMVDEPNNKIQGQRILTKYKALYTTGSGGSSPKTHRPKAHKYQQWKLVTNVFHAYFASFLEAVEEAYRIWVLDFSCFPLLANLFYGWVAEHQSSTGEHSPTTAEHSHINRGQDLERKGMSCLLQKFLLRMFLIFCQWCYCEGYVDIYVSRKREGFKVHIQV